MMSRDMSGLQRGVVRFDHTPLLHMHALCIVKQGGKPIHMVDPTAHPNIQSPLLDAVLAMPTQVSNLLGQGPIPIGMQRSIPMTYREAGNRRKRCYPHTHLATPSLHPPWYTLQATSGLCTHQVSLS